MLNIATMKLADLIEAARKHVITPEEHRAQVISFAYGNIAIENPLITRELVESVYDQLLATDRSGVTEER